MTQRASCYSLRERELSEQKPIFGVQRRRRPDRQACAIATFAIAIAHDFRLKEIRGTPTPTSSETLGVGDWELNRRQSISIMPQLLRSSGDASTPAYASAGTASREGTRAFA